MHLESALDILRRHRHELQQLGVKSIALFGSVVREEARPESDIDILVEFARPVGLFAFFRLQHRLEDLMGMRVDLATPAALKRQLRDRILKEAVYVE
ncbi:MAG TPA: nucleotidyltransferase family protein [Syntrophobacteraceae bacterium]|nr:nucleotidyltransferase family protein [Syntrophobacteraceae bacterium]